MTRGKNKNKGKNGIIASVILATTIMISSSMAMQSHGQIQMLIDGEKNENRLIATNKAFNHKVLRNAYQMSKLTPLEKKLFEFEERIKRDKLRRGDKMIQRLKKRLKRVKVFTSKKQLQNKKAKRDFLMLKYQPNKVAKLEDGLVKRAQKQKYGVPLSTLVKKKGNPFNEFVDLQVLIDEAEAPEIKKKQDEKKEMEAMMKKRGMKGVVSHVKKK